MNRKLIIATILICSAIFAIFYYSGKPPKKETESEIVFIDTIKTIKTIKELDYSRRTQLSSIDEVEGMSEGTKIDTMSRHYKHAVDNGFKLYAFDFSSCKGGVEEFNVQNHIVDISINELETSIIVGITEYCCVSFIGTIEIQNDTVNLLYKTYKDYCDCMCCYSLEYRIETSKPISGYKLNNVPIDFLSEDLEVEDFESVEIQ